MKRICAILMAFLLTGCGGGGVIGLSPEQPALSYRLQAPVNARLSFDNREIALPCMWAP